MSLLKADTIKPVTSGGDLSLQGDSGGAAVDCLNITSAGDINFTGNTNAKIKLPSAGGIYKSNGTTAILTESGGAVTLDNVIFAGAADVTTFARWRTASGFGSTDDKIFTFSDEDIAGDDVVVTVTNTSANGFKVVANMDCSIFWHHTQDFGGAAYWGISKNSTQLDTSILSIAATHRMMTNYTSGADVNNIVSWSGPLSSGDIVRPHNDGGSLGGNPGRCLISVFAMKKI